MYPLRYIGRILSRRRPVRQVPCAGVSGEGDVAMRRPYSWLAIGFLFAAGAVAAPRTAVDANGDAVTLAGPPERIVVAGKAALIPSDALFLFPEGRKHLLRLARVDQGMGNLFALLEPGLAAEGGAATMQNGGTEELAALRPDLVIAKTASTATVVGKLRPLGIPCFAMSLETPEEWLRELPELGRLLGEEARAADVCGMIRSRMEAVAAGVQAALSAPGAVRPRVLVLQASAADGTMSFSVSPDSCCHSLRIG